MTKKLIYLLLSLSVIMIASAQEELPTTGEGGEQIIYRYKQFQRFDFEDLVIEGETGGPGDLSIAPRYQRRFQNKLPYRKNFNAEIRRGIERVR
jgi:hypothetical protein